jgi:hypothetical protein
MSDPNVAANRNTSFSLSSAARFWETRRLFYNLVLTATAIFWTISTWPHFQSAIALSSLAKLFVLALFANLCYSAAYLADLGIQQLPDLSHHRYRTILWALGTICAIIIESYWINDEIYPDFKNALATFLRSSLLC